jgi:hypothetical protein
MTVVVSPALVDRGHRGRLRREGRRAKAALRLLRRRARPPVVRQATYERRDAADRDQRGEAAGVVAQVAHVEITATA